MSDDFCQVDLLAHLWRYPTVSIHGIEGAFSDPGTKTVIPAKVTAKFSIRQVPDMDPAMVKKQVHWEGLSSGMNCPAPHKLLWHCWIIGWMFRWQIIFSRYSPRGRVPTSSKSRWWSGQSLGWPTLSIHCTRLGRQQSREVPQCNTVQTPYYSEYFAKAKTLSNYLSMS